MKTIRLIIDLTYDDNIMHGDDYSARKWFVDEIIFGNNLILHDNDSVGDDIGEVRVIDLIATNPEPKIKATRSRR